MEHMTEEHKRYQHITFRDIIKNVLNFYDESTLFDEFIVNQLNQNNDVFVGFVLLQYYDSEQIQSNNRKLRNIIRKYVGNKMLYGTPKFGMSEYIETHHQSIEEEDIRLFAIVCENILCNTIKELVQITSNDVVTRKNYYQMLNFSSQMSSVIERIYDH
jgi:hypothetical protein